jgi:hypothetical protein
MVIMHVCPTVPSHLRRSQLEPKSARSVQRGGPAPLALLHPPLRLVTAKDPRGGHPQRRPWSKVIISLSRRVFTSWRQQCPSCKCNRHPLLLLRRVCDDGRGGRWVHTRSACGHSAFDPPVQLRWNCKKYSCERNPRRAGCCSGERERQEQPFA